MAYDTPWRATSLSKVKKKKKWSYLAISYARVAAGVGSEDPAEGSDAHLILEGVVLRHGAVQVPLDLLRGQGTAAHGLLHPLSVVARVGVHLILSSWRGDGLIDGWGKWLTQ